MVAMISMAVAASSPTARANIPALVPARRACVRPSCTVMGQQLAATKTALVAAMAPALIRLFCCWRDEGLRGGQITRQQTQQEQ